MNYKQRLLQEFAELVEKITRLRVFIEHQEDSEENDLYHSNETLLHKQLDSMLVYQSVLQERIEKELG